MNIIPVANDKPFPFGRLPPDMQGACASFLSDEDLTNLRLVSRAIRNVPARIPPNPALQEVCKKLYLLNKQRSQMDDELLTLIDKDFALDRAILEKDNELTWAKIHDYPQETIQQLEAEKTDLKRQKEATRQQINEKCGEQMQLGHEAPLIEQRGEALFVNLFGSQETFDQLPVLDIRGRDINTIHVDEMTAPIMRGVSDGRIFVALCVKRQDGDETRLAGQVFFQSLAGTFNHWSNVILLGTEFRPFGFIPESIIRHGHIPCTNPFCLQLYRVLRETIQGDGAVFEEPSFPTPIKKVILTKATMADLEQRKAELKQQAAAAAAVARVAALAAAAAGLAD